MKKHLLIGLLSLLAAGSTIASAQAYEHGEGRWGCGRGWHEGMAHRNWGGWDHDRRSSWEHHGWRNPAWHEAMEHRDWDGWDSDDRWRGRHERWEHRHRHDWF